MKPKQIVSDADVLSGRYRFEGTRIPVSLVVSHDEAWLLDNYPSLTAADIRAGKAFTWPPLLNAPEVEVEESIDVQCVCGEWIEDLGEVGFDRLHPRCRACGRRYDVHHTVAAEVAEVDITRLDGLWPDVDYGRSSE